MTTKKAILEVRRHSRLSAIIIAIALSTISTIYTFVTPHPSLEAAATPSTIGAIIDSWQWEHPVWSAIFVWLGIIYLSIKMGQITSKFYLYGTKSNISIEVFPMLYVALTATSTPLQTVVVALLVGHAMVQYVSSYRNTNSLDSLLGGSLSLGFATLLYPPTIALWVVVPSLIVIFERTTREMIVATLSLLIAPVGYVYAQWVMGAEFGEELRRFFDLIVTPSSYSVWSSSSVPTLAIIGFVLCVSINSILTTSLLENTFKARRRLNIITIYAVAIGAMLAIPSADGSTLMFIAIPLSVLIPITMLNMGRLVSFIIYVLLLACGVVKLCVW